MKIFARYLTILGMIICGVWWWESKQPGPIVTFIFALAGFITTDISKKQKEAPILIPRWDGTTLRIKNIGKISALNISIEDITQKNCKLQFHKISLCEPEKEPGVGRKLFENGKEIIASGEVDQKIKVFIPGNLGDNKHYIIFITYQDTESTRWQTKHQVTDKEIIFKGITKKGEL